MKTSHCSTSASAVLSLVLAISTAGSDCSAQIIFDADPSNDFNDPDNWTIPAAFPSAVESFLIQDNHTAVFSSGDTTLGGLTVSNDSFGRLRMTGGSLTLLNTIESLEIGRERFPRPKQGDYNNNGLVDGRDLLIWQRTLGDEVLNEGDGADGDESGFIDDGDFAFWAARYGLVTKGGELVLTGNSTLTTNGAAVGRRSKGVIEVGPNAVVNVQGRSATSPEIKNRDLEVGNYGPAYIAITNEPGLEGNGLAIIEGTVNANALMVNVFGAKGEVRLLPGGNIHLSGALVLSHCDTQFFPNGCGLVANPQPLMSSRLEIIGSGGSFTVGEYDPDLSPPPGHDPDIRRDIRSEYPSTATMSFTADANGVTPIVLADNSAAGQLTGAAYLDGTEGNVPGTYAAINLELNLDAYAGSARITLIDAPPGRLEGVFNPTITYLGSTTATINYDYDNGDVFLTNFQSASAAGAALIATVPEPTVLALAALTLGLLSGLRTVWR